MFKNFFLLHSPVLSGRKQFLRESACLGQKFSFRNFLSRCLYLLLTAHQNGMPNTEPSFSLNGLYVAIRYRVLSQ